MRGFRTFSSRSDERDPDESGAGIHRAPLAGEVRAELPRRRAAHRETAHDHAVEIHRVGFLHVLESLELRQRVDRRHDRLGALLEAHTLLGDQLRQPDQDLVAPGLTILLDDLLAGHPVERRTHAVLADRLAESFAERMHQRVRRELWGYAPDENLSNDALIAEDLRAVDALIARRLDSQVALVRTRCLAMCR